MLVKRSIVERWYQRDSWVYKNFSYLFDNPLWSKKVPNGFSVCPYFWLSLFSVFIFRPFFVVPINYLFRPLVHALGKPARVVDKACVWVVNLLPFPNKLSTENTPTGAGCLLGVVWLICSVCLGLLMWKFGVWSLDIYRTFDGLTLGKFAWWGAASFIGLWGVIGVHKLFTKTECKTINYVWVWFIVFSLAALVCIPGEIGHGIIFALSTIAHDVAGFCVFLGKGTWGLFTLFFGWIWTGTKYTFSWKPIVTWMLPWWGYLVVLSVVGYVFDKLGKSLDNWELSKLERNQKEDYKAKCRRRYIELFCTALKVDSDFTRGRIFTTSDFRQKLEYSDYRERAVRYYKETLFAAAFEVQFKETLDKLQEHYPNTMNLHWKAIESGAGNSALAALNLLANAIGIQPLDFGSGSFRNALIAACDIPEIHKSIEEAAKGWKKADEDKEKRKNARKNGWAHQTCLRVTSALGYGAGVFFRSVGRGFAKAWHQFATFCAYMWMLVKAKKQGACPYITFSDPLEKK